MVGLQDGTHCLSATVSMLWDENPVGSPNERGADYGSERKELTSQTVMTMEKTMLEKEQPPVPAKKLMRK